MSLHTKFLLYTLIGSRKLLSYCLRSFCKMLWLLYRANFCTACLRWFIWFISSLSLTHFYIIVQVIVQVIFRLSTLLLPIIVITIFWTPGTSKSIEIHWKIPKISNHFIVKFLERFSNLPWLLVIIRWC